MKEIIRLKVRGTQSKKEYWINIRLSDLYFNNYTSTPEEIQLEVTRKVNKQIADYLQITNKVHTI